MYERIKKFHRERNSRLMKNSRMEESILFSVPITRMKINSLNQTIKPLRKCKKIKAYQPIAYILKSAAVQRTNAKLFPEAIYR